MLVILFFIFVIWFLIKFINLQEKQNSLQEEQNEILRFISNKLDKQDTQRWEIPSFFTDQNSLYTNLHYRNLTQIPQCAIIVYKSHIKPQLPIVQNNVLHVVVHEFKTLRKTIAIKKKFLLASTISPKLHCITPYFALPF